MRKYALRIGYIAIGTTLALLGAPVAHADDASFVTAARALGMQEPSDYVINSGRSACFQLSLGSSAAKLADRMTTTGLEPDQAAKFIALSVHDYCPQFNDRLAG